MGDGLGVESKKALVLALDSLAESLNDAVAQLTVTPEIVPWHLFVIVDRFFSLAIASQMARVPGKTALWAYAVVLRAIEACATPKPCDEKEAQREFYRMSATLTRFHEMYEFHLTRRLTDAATDEFLKITRFLRRVAREIESEIL
ncbi:MAG: hypothetical protein HY459_03865 [Parcubacteria group bacterium]|nr:hypothetical protein [Parcubacteria group bacterium]